MDELSLEDLELILSALYGLRDGGRREGYTREEINRVIDLVEEEYDNG